MEITVIYSEQQKREQEIQLETNNQQKMVEMVCTSEITLTEFFSSHNNNF